MTNTHHRNNHQHRATKRRPTTSSALLFPMALMGLSSSVSCGSANALGPASSVKASGFQSLAQGPLSGRKIIGNNDLVPVDPTGNNIPQQFRGLLDAFGRISVSCTATHIGHGIVITAGHCFRAQSERQDNLSCDHIKVEWGARKGVAPYLVSTCQVILAQETSDAADYAIFKVDEVPRATAQIAQHQPELGRPVTVFGHPLQRTLEWSGICELLNPSQGGFSSSNFSHQCDTEAGNSGSAVLDAESGHIVGIHNGGVAPFNYGMFIHQAPVGQFEAYYSGREEVPALPDEEGTISFGKLDLGHNETDKELVDLAQANKSSVNFKLTVHLEGKNDSIVLEDGEGRRSSRITGKGVFEMSGMKAPVRILFSSDASGLSTLVKVSRISYF